MYSFCGAGFVSNANALENNTVEIVLCQCIYIKMIDEILMWKIPNYIGS